MHWNIVDSMNFVFQYFAYDNYHVESFMFTINTKITTGLVMVCCLLAGRKLTSFANEEKITN